MPTTEAKKGSGWIDSHCHLDEVEHLTERLAEAAKQQINTFIIPGTAPAQWQKALALNSPHIHLTAGTHPWYVSNPTEELKALEQWLEGQTVIAVGEIGLDYYQGKQPRPEQALQLETFEGQLALAKQYDLPVILHCVKAHNDVLRLLKKNNVTKGVVHAFSGSIELAQNYVDQGFHIGVGPMILKSPKTLNAVSQIPLERILLETDAPFMATQPLNAANPLLDLLRVAEKLAEQTSLSIGEIQTQTRINTQQLFGI
ncbi:TatD family hydrolase [Reinekea sp.]|jgi:TatD DNase family protein|uniref:TatD family hydrolase n=1 Tax=Reinekea sp. TaxID=1970455 RepID=UPI003989C1FA